MVYLIGLIIILAILFWRANSRYEWNIPLEWQFLIGGWRERLSKESQSVNFVWELGSENGEMEKRLWLLQRALPSLQRSDKLPVWIEVQINSDLPPEQNEKYIACLQRRFSEVKICVSPLNKKSELNC